MPYSHHGIAALPERVSALESLTTNLEQRIAVLEARADAVERDLAQLEEETP
jgi:prefoldin subunit 5